MNKIEIQNAYMELGYRFTTIGGECYICKDGKIVEQVRDIFEAEKKLNELK